MAGYMMAGYGMQGVQPMQLTAEQQQQQYQQYQQMQQQQQLQQQQYQQQYQQYQQQQQQQQQQQMQPQQYQQYQQQPQQQGSQGPLSVAGCADPTVGNIVRGTFSLMTENHGRPVYKKNEVVANNPTLDVLIYFWDERDGANFCGWWFGPKVGGDQVWAYNSERSATPPSTGWRVPYDGSVDPSFVISGGQGGQQAYGQQYQQQPYQQQMYGQQQMTPQQYQQQQMQQQQMQQQQMMQQKQREEEQRRQEQQRRAEQQGVMNCQQILQKLTGVTPETIDHIKDEVEKMVMQELPKCGSQAEAVRAEAAQQIQMAQVRVEQVKQQRIEEERLNGERCEFAKKAEQDTAALKTTAAPVLESKIMSEEDARSAGKAVSEVSVAAKASCKACSDFIVERRMNIDSVKPPLLAPLREEQLKIQERIQECYKVVVSSTISAKVMIDKAVKKTAATKTLEKRTSAFEKYNGKREVMTIDEILAYAKGEYSFAFSKEAAAVVAKKYGDGKSVPRVHFQRIKVAVGIAREEEASKARKKEELKRLALEAKKKAIEADIQKVADVLAEAEPAIAKAEEAGKTEQLSRDYLNATPDKDAVVTATESASAALKDAQGELGDVRTRLSDLVSSADDDVKQWVTIEIRKVEMKVASMDARLVQTGQATERGRHFLQMLEAKELHAAKIDVAKLLRSKKLDIEELFKAADKDGDGFVNLADFTALIEGCEGCQLSGEKIEQVYNMYNDAGSSSGFSKETLFLASRSYYFVAAETVLSSTDNLESETVRRLELKELLEVLEGPVEEASAKISRVRCRAVFDGIEGWVTVTGNNGTEYLMASDGNLEVVREVPLTDALHEGNVLRQLSHGEKLEVLEWDKKNPVEDVRVQVKVKGSTDMGWVTRASADGMQYLKIQ